MSSILVAMAVTALSQSITVRESCTSSSCNSGCQSSTFQLDRCATSRTGPTFMVTACNATKAAVTFYRDTTCTQMSSATTWDLNKCDKDENLNTYVERTCSGSPPTPPTDGYFTVTHCSNTNCSDSCKKSTFRTQRCTQLAGERPLIVNACNATHASVTTFQDGFCIAMQDFQVWQLNVCTRDTNTNDYVTKSCGSN